MSGPVVVQKFGGTSVSTAAGREAVCTRVRARLDEGRSVVVVVSAMGRAGDPYATDTLLSLIGGSTADAREADLLASCGEVISAVVLAHELRSCGVPARAMTGPQAGVLTDEVFGDATVLGVDPAALSAALAEGVVPVVTGFQGLSTSGELTTLGRGGSDTSACAIGAALHAEVVEIHTDVDGVLSADPRVCDGVRLLDRLQFEELFQMALTGAKVMHAPAAEIAMGADVPVLVRNTHGSAKGTLITKSDTLAGGLAPRVATAVTHASGISRFVVTLPDEGPDRAAAITAVFRAMAEEGVSLDMFTPLDGALAFSVEAGSSDRAAHVLTALEAPFARTDALAKVTLVGAGMHGVPGVMARIADTLTRVGIEILQVADSHYTISALVSEARLTDAINALHDEFALGVE